MSANYQTTAQDEYQAGKSWKFRGTEGSFVSSVYLPNAFKLNYIQPYKSSPINGAGAIVFNGGSGVAVDPGSSSATNIGSNSIHSNAGLGIDLGLDGVTPNDPGDGDTGANALQNFPVLASVESSTGGTKIEGTLNSTPNDTFTLEFFSNNACDPSGFGEGQQFLGSTSVTTDASGDAEFNVTFETTVPAGSFVTSTAADSMNFGATSEFSQCIEVESDATAPQVTIDASKTMLWPPNHDLVDVGFTYTAQDNSDPNPVVSIGVTSNQPAEDPATGDTFSPDARLVKDSTDKVIGLRLRAERNTDPDGRIYLIQVTATDRSGNSSACFYAVAVPRSAGEASSASARARSAAEAQAPLAYNVLGPPPDGPAPEAGSKQ